MAFSIKNPETDRVARKLARVTGESLTTAVDTALRERLERVSPAKHTNKRVDRVRRIVRELSTIPDVDTRSVEEMLYGRDGAPQ